MAFSIDQIGISLHLTSEWPCQKIIGILRAKLNQDQIYYFKTRGVDEQTAKSILQKAFLLEVIESIQNKEIKDFSSKLLDNLI